MYTFVPQAGLLNARMVDEQPILFRSEDRCIFAAGASHSPARGGGSGGAAGAARLYHTWTLGWRAPLSPSPCTNAWDSLTATSLTAAAMYTLIWQVGFLAMLTVDEQLKAHPRITAWVSFYGSAHRLLPACGVLRVGQQRHRPAISTAGRTLIARET